LENIYFTGYITFTADKAVALLELSRLRFNAVFIYGDLKFSSYTTFDLEHRSFTGMFKVTVSF
jgi:hypothetical protein